MYAYAIIGLIGEISGHVQLAHTRNAFPGSIYSLEASSDETTPTNTWQESALTKCRDTNSEVFQNTRVVRQICIC